MAKKIHNERLIIRNLKNVRITFLVQTIGIVAVLIYYAALDGVTAVVQDPLWLVLLVSLIVFFALHLKISKDLQDHSKRAT